MALKTESCNIDDSLGIKIEGELEDFQIIEENSDSDDDRTDSKNSRTLAIPNIPSSLLKPSSSPICGNVAVSHSENVVIGNNTYFNGPVVIKQVIQNSPGLENPSYVKDDNEDVPVQRYHEETKSHTHNAFKKFHIRKWHKITFSAVCVIILGGIFAILSIILSNTSQEDNYSPTVTEGDSDAKSNYTKVVGLYYENLNFIIIIIILIPLTFMLMFYTLLTLEGSGNNKSMVMDMVKHGGKRQCNRIEDDYDYSMRPLEKDNPLLIAPDYLRIVSRTDWLAQPVENKLDEIRQPVPWVIISHTATESCRTQSECVLRVRLIQMFHIESRKWFDIGYNFLVAGDGSAYYGRGWDYIGAHTQGYNKYSIGISFIGTFNNDPPPKKQIDACIKLLKRGVELGKLAKDYKLFAHRQLASTLSPGDKLYDIIREWPHFVKNFTDISELIPKY